MARLRKTRWVIGIIWNSPNTLLGFLLGTLSLCRPNMVAGIVEFQMRRGPVLAVCNRLGISAFTIGDCVMYAVTPTPALRVHEGRHVAQYRALGPIFLPAYFLLLATFGYQDHPLEKDARAHELAKLGEVSLSRITHQ